MMKDKQNNTNEEQISFDELTNSTINQNNKDNLLNVINFPKNKTYSDKTKIVFAKYERDEIMNPVQLFEGFDTLKVLTYSYGLKFVEEISDMFENMTVIIGNPNLVDGTAFELIVASQLNVIPEIKKYKKLVQKVVDNQVTFYRLNGILSHQKIYLLSTKDGRKRVVLGSANLSSVAWKNGPFNQEEDFIVLDNDEKAYSVYNDIFADLKSIYATPIEEKKVTNIIETVKEKISELPCVDEIIKNEQTAIILNEDPDIEKTKTIYLIRDTYNNIKESEEVNKISLTQKNKTGISVLLPKQVKKLAKLPTIYIKKDYVHKMPKFYINCDIQQAFLDNEQFDLNSENQKNLKNDVKILLNYFNGYDNFIGTEKEKEQAKKTYYKMLVYMFLSPFIALLRTEAYNTDYGIELFPMFAIIQGKKSAGKSQFVNTVRRFMFPNAIFEDLISKDFTQKTIWGYINTVEGIPVHIEDLLETQFNRNSGNVIKSETEILNQEIKNHGIYIATTNEIKSLPASIKKRMYYAHIPLTQKDTNSTRKKKIVSTLLDGITGQLYISYLQKIIPEINDLILKMRTIIPDANDSNHWNPDVFELSSKILMELFKEAEIDIPSYCGIVTYDDYFDWPNVKEETIEWFQTQCLYNLEAFKINRKQNVLEYNAGPAPERNYNKEAPVDTAFNRFPDELNAQKVGNKVIVDLNLTEKFFNVRFKENRFKKGSYKIAILCENKD